MKKQKSQSQKELYCPVCKNYPNTIIEEYEHGARETRQWTGQHWELIDSDIEDIEFRQLCEKCDSKLIAK